MPNLKRVPKRRPAKKVPVAKTVAKTATVQNTTHQPIKLKKTPAKKVAPMSPADGKLLVQFLKSFGHKKNLFLYNQNGNVLNSGGNHKFISTEILGDALKANTSNTCSDVYFYINNKPKQLEVKKAHACFIDLDAGRDAKGQYLGPARVELWKTKMRNAINSFKLSPSWVVETRNGYQLYWVFNQPTSNISIWNGLQKKLVNHFSKVGADCRAIKPNQIFRVPFTIWWKPWEKKTKYMTRICTESNGHKIDIADLELALTGQKTVIQNVAAANKKTSDHWANLNALKSKQTGGCTQPILIQKIAGPNPTITKANLTLDQQKTETLELTVQFLNQVQNILKYTNNQFLASSAKTLAEQIGQQFCI